MGATPNEQAQSLAVGAIAVVVQLGLAAAVGAVVLYHLAADAAAAGPWALAYLTWSARALRRLAGYQREVRGRRR